MTPARRANLLRWMLHILYFVLLSILQLTPGLLPSIAGATPMLLVPAVACAAMFESEVAGSVLAVVAGFLSDVFSERPLGYSSIVLLVFACFLGLLIRYVMRRHIFTALLFTAATVLVYELLNWLFFYCVWGGVDNGYVLLHIVLPRALYTYAVTPLFYLIESFFHKRIRERE